MTRHRNDRFRPDDRYDFDEREYRRDFADRDRRPSQGNGEVWMDDYMRGDYRRGDTDASGQGFINRSSRRYADDRTPRQTHDGQWQYRSEEEYVADQGRRELGDREYGSPRDPQFYGRRVEQPYYGERREEDRWTEGPARRAVQVSGAYSAQEAAGGYRGKGPRGYQRSDERIREEANDALHDAYNVDASDIEVTVENGEITLSGTVADRAQKRAAADAVEHLRGVRDVHNQLRLQSNLSADTLNR